MKTVLLALLLVLFADCILLAQETVVVKAGERITDVLAFKQVYRYPHFIPGRVFFRDGKEAAGKFNYNMLVAEVQFLDEKGDTLSLANEKTLRQVVIAADTFYYNPVCVRAVLNTPGVKLGERMFYQEFVQKPGSYGLSTATTATNSVDMLVEPRAIRLNTDQEVTLVKRTQYLFAGKYAAYVPASRKNLLKEFSKYRTEINNYLDYNSVDYTKRDDMEKLLRFLAGIVQ